MKEIIILLMSPHKDGVSDHLAQYFEEGLSQGNNPVRSFALRDFNFNNCDGCNSCLELPHICKFNNKDNLSFLYSTIQNAALAVLVSPIYFYTLPAKCIAFIDRAQALWNSRQNNKLCKAFPPGLALLAAGRAKGKKLFTAASLCLSCFYNSLGSSLLTKYCFKQLENLSALEAKPEIKSFLFAKGKDWAHYISLNNSRLPGIA